LQQNQGPRAIGAGGCDLGYAGITNSIAIEFDTYCSSDTRDDPNGNHVSVHTRGKLPNSSHHRDALSQNSRITTTLNDGQLHHCHVVYLNKTLFVALDSVPVLRVPDLDIAATIDATDAWIGFTAATGGINQAHQVSSLKLTTLHGSLPAHCLLNTANYDRMAAKIRQLNGNEVASISRAPLSLEAPTLDAVLSLLPPSSEPTTFTDQQRAGLRVMFDWPSVYIFPILDLASMVAQHRWGAEQLALAQPDLESMLLRLLQADGSPVPTLVTSLRTLANLAIFRRELCTDPTLSLLCQVLDSLLDKHASNSGVLSNAAVVILKYDPVSH